MLKMLVNLFAGVLFVELCIAFLGTGLTPVFAFFAAMIVGMALYKWIS